MVIFVLTRAGFSDHEAEIRTAKHSVWLNQAVLDDDKIKALRANGVDVSTFSHPVDPKDLESIDNALGTISMHHPGERIWVEFQAGDCEDET